jgi:1-acyl-sn-glycerol-3-phosphate acyltransferase
MRPFFRFTTFLLRCFFNTFYRFKIDGIDQPLQGSAIIAPNHTSFFDPPIIGMAWPEETHFLGRASLFKHFYMRWLLQGLNTHPVHGSPQDIQSIKILCKLLSEGKKVVIFPEGERSHDGQLLNIKSGVAMLALRMKCPIIPAYIEGAYEAWPRNSRFPKFGSRITCIFGKPIPIEPYLNMKKKEAQEAISRDLQEKLAQLKKECYA